MEECRQQVTKAEEAAEKIKSDQERTIREIREESRRAQEQAQQAAAAQMQQMQQMMMMSAMMGGGGGGGGVPVDMGGHSSSAGQARGGPRGAPRGPGRAVNPWNTF